MEKRLIKLLLNREFFLKNIRYLISSMFPNELKGLFDTIKYAHETFQHENLTLIELHDLHLTLNPALTYAAKNNLDILLEELQNEQTINADIADEVLKAAYQREIARQIGQTAVNIINARGGSFDSILRILNLYNNPISEALDPVPEDLETVLKGSEENTRWKFNIETLKSKIAGVGPGSFSIFAMRPELGKTALWVSLAAGPGGWCEQGARISAFCNEEPASRTMLRAWSCRTGFTKDQLIQYKDKARELYDPIRGRLNLYDCVGIKLDEIAAKVEIDKPDIVIIDQLDKVHIDGTFNRSDEKLREIYTTARELAKINNVAAIGISQLSADAQGKAFTDFSMLENSKTGKAAEADLIICGGANSFVEDDGIRHLNLAKNKISGDHSTVIVKLQQELSRYVE